MENDLKDFIPPMPLRLPEGTPIWTKLMAARDNLVAGWTQDCYERKVFDFSVLNQRYVVCNDAVSVRQVFLEKHDNYDRKSPQMRHALQPLLGDGLFVSDGDLWRRRRDACAPSLRSEHLSEYVASMASTTLEMAEAWSQRDGSKIDVLDEMARLTARIIGRTIFGDDTPEEEARQVVSGFSRYVQSIEQADFGSTLGLPCLRHVFNPLGAMRAHRSARSIHAVIDRVIVRHHARDDVKKNRSSLLAHLLAVGGDTLDEGAAACPLSDIAARNEAIVMFMAGHETTANTLTWAWYLLAACPDYRMRLHEELDTVIGDREPQLEDVARLTFTRAIIEETLRLYPPVPVLSRQARGPDVIRDTKVNAGDVILVVPWLLHRHEKYWDGPNAFRPERFLPEAKRPDRFIYIPFSVGHRVCLGQRFGLTEAIVCLAILARRFDLELPPDSNIKVSCRLTLRPEGGLPMLVRAKQKAH